MLTEKKKLLWLLKHNNCWIDLQAILTNSTKTNLKSMFKDYMMYILHSKKPKKKSTDITTAQAAAHRAYCVQQFNQNAIILRDITEIDFDTFRYDNADAACDFLEHNLVTHSKDGFCILPSLCNDHYLERFVCANYSGRVHVPEVVIDDNYMSPNSTTYRTYIYNSKKYICAVNGDAVYNSNIRAIGGLILSPDIDLSIYDYRATWFTGKNVDPKIVNKDVLKNGHLRYKFDEVRNFCVRGRLVTYTPIFGAYNDTSEYVGSLTSFANFPNVVHGNLVLMNLYGITSYKGFPKHIHGNLILDGGKYPEKSDLPKDIEIDGNISVFTNDCITVLAALVRSNIKMKPGKNIISPLYSGSLENLREVAKQKNWDFTNI